MPTELRKLLSNPIKNGGIIAPGDPDKSIPQTIAFLDEVGAFNDKNLKFICVGDVVSEAFYKIPKLRNLVKYFIVDGVTQRGTQKFEFNFHFLDEFKFRKFENRPGTISSKIMHFMSQTCRNENQYIIEIDGEEDLLSIPAITYKFTDEPHFVFYGQPPFTDVGIDIPAGLVTVWTTPEIRKQNAIHFNQFIRKEFE